ncbi:hypothetical protein ABZ769_23680 [Streptomyces olivoreticuli]
MAIATVAASGTEAAALGRRTLRVRGKDTVGHAIARLPADGEIDIHIHITVAVAVAVTVAVEHRDSLAPGKRQLLHAPLHEELFNAVLPPGHRLTVKSEPGLTDLCDDRRITPWPGNPVHQAVLRACEETRFQPPSSASRTTSPQSVPWSPSARALHSSPARPCTASVPRCPAVRPLRGPGPARRVFTAIRQRERDSPALPGLDRTAHPGHCAHHALTGPRTLTRRGDRRGSGWWPAP